MRIVDEETRRLVMQNRIDSLEGDKLFQNYKEHEIQDAEVDSQANDAVAEFLPNEASSSSSSELDSDGEDQKAFATTKKQKSIKKEKTKVKKVPKPMPKLKKAAPIQPTHNRKRPLVDLARLYEPSYY